MQLCDVDTRRGSKILADTFCRLAADIVSRGIYELPINTKDLNANDRTTAAAKVEVSGESKCRSFRWSTLPLESQHKTSKYTCKRLFCNLSAIIAPRLFLPWHQHTRLNRAGQPHTSCTLGRKRLDRTTVQHRLGHNNYLLISCIQVDDSHCCRLGQGLIGHYREADSQ